ncbi:hypothetical protein C8R44DRAFT_928165 [Mycena epipterygia]|nr:hypothetical protein C8R44DRAFT_928165 [Mycena epipterygia]
MCETNEDASGRTSAGLAGVGIDVGVSVGRCQGREGGENDSARRRMRTCTLDVMPVLNNFDSANARIKPSMLTQSALHPAESEADGRCGWDRGRSVRREEVTVGILRASTSLSRSNAHGKDYYVLQKCDENKARPSRRGIAQAARAVVDRGHREMEEGRAHSAAEVTKTEFQRRPRQSRAHLEPGKSWYEVAVAMKKRGQDGWALASKMRTYEFENRLAHARRTLTRCGTKVTPGVAMCDVPGPSFWVDLLHGRDSQSGAPHERIMRQGVKRATEEQHKR